MRGTASTSPINHGVTTGRRRRRARATRDINDRRNARPHLRGSAMHDDRRRGHDRPRRSTPTDKALHRIGFWIVLVGGSGVGLAAALAAFVAAAALRPVRRLTAAAENVAATGDLAERVDVTAMTSWAGSRRGSTRCSRRSSGRSARSAVWSPTRRTSSTPLTAARTNVDLLARGEAPGGRSAARARRGVRGARRADAARRRSRRARPRGGARARIEDVQLDDLVASVVERARRGRRR